MEACERLVKEWISEEKQEGINGLVGGISTGDITLLNLVKSLGEYLTADDGNVRGKGVSLLSQVLEKCPRDKVNRQSTRVLTAFYCEKLDDIDTVIPSFKGILSLSFLPHFVGSDAVETFNALVAHAKMKSYVQSVRYIVFKIIDSLVARHREALKKLGTEFVKGYVKLAEGEKDPRNLLLAFSIGRVVLIEFEISGHLEDLFDITFCYFPITFKPPPDDPYGITTEDLKSALRSCLSATPLFGPLAIPLFLEKLSATAGHVKRDTLQTLCICLPVYGVSTARSFAAPLWEAIKVEIFQPLDTDTEQNALRGAQALLKTLYSSSVDAVEGLAVDICQECVKILQEPEKNQAQHAIKVLGACIGTTPSVTRYALSQGVPHLIKLYLNPEESSHRPVILAELVSLVTAVKNVYSYQENERTYAEEKVLDAHRDQILGAFTSGLKVASTRKASIDGMLQLVSIPHLLTEEEVGFVLHNVNELFDPAVDIDDIRGPILDLLAAISKASPKLVEETTLPLLFSSLPDRAPNFEATSERSAYQRTLKSLSTLCVQPALFETLVIRLIAKLDLLCHLPDEVMLDENARTCNAAYAHSILVTLGNVIDYKVDAKQPDVPRYMDRLVPRLFALFIEPAVSAERSFNPITDDHRLIEVTGNIFASILRTVTAEQQEIFMRNSLGAYQRGEFQLITGVHLKVEPIRKFQPLEPSSPTIQKHLVALLALSMVVTRKEVKVLVDDVSAFLDQILDWCLASAADGLGIQTACHILASVVNKHADDCSVFLSKRLDTLWTETIAAPTCSLESRKCGLEVWVWVTRALLCRNHSRANANVEMLFNLFGDERIGWDVARAIGELGREERVVLTKKNDCIIRLFVVQKYSTKVLPIILEAYKASPAGSIKQAANLVALTTLINHLPRRLYSTELPSLMPLLLRSLDLSDLDIRTNVIDTLTAVAREDTSDGSGSLADHASSIIKFLLTNCLPGDLTSKKLRVASLRCLGILPNAVRYTVLHPLKPEVIQTLGKALDDQNREVRKMAVDSRAVWYAVTG